MHHYIVCFEFSCSETESIPAHTGNTSRYTASGRIELAITKKGSTMADNLLGLLVTRAIPQEVLVGLMAGQYKAYGGVIRWAAGTEHAGQIVRHLIPVGLQTITDPLFGSLNGMLNIANTYQKIGVTTQTILQMSTGTMVLSGLNLAVSAIGFTVIYKKLKQLENQLNRIEKEVKATFGSLIF